MHAEWTKLRTVRTTAWLLLATVGFTVLVGLATVVSADLSRCPPDAACVVDPTRLSLTGVWLGQAAVAVLAVLAVTNEYHTQMILTSLTASPRRVTHLLARAAVVTGAVLAAAGVAVAASLLVGRVVLRGNGFTAANGFSEVSFVDGTTLRAGTGTVLYFGLVALLGVGVGAIIRDSTWAVTAILALLYGFPIAATFLASDPQWYERLQRIGPTTAGLAVQATVRLEQLPIGPWAGLGVLAAWAGAAMLLGTVLFTVRDA